MSIIDRYKVVNVQEYSYSIYQGATTIKGVGTVYEDENLLVVTTGERVEYTVKELASEGELILHGKNYNKLSTFMKDLIYDKEGKVTTESVSRHAKALSNEISKGKDNLNTLPDVLIELVMPLLVAWGLLVTLL